MATGMPGKMRMPAFPGMDKFKGVQQHSSEHGGPPEFVGFVGLSGVFLFNFRPWLPGGQSSAPNGN